MPRRCRWPAECRIPLLRLKSTAELKHFTCAYCGHDPILIYVAWTYLYCSPRFQAEQVGTHPVSTTRSACAAAIVVLLLFLPAYVVSIVLSACVSVSWLSLTAVFSPVVSIITVVYACMQDATVSDHRSTDDRYYSHAIHAIFVQLFSIAICDCLI